MQEWYILIQTFGTTQVLQTGAVGVVGVVLRLSKCSGVHYNFLRCVCGGRGAVRACVRMLVFVFV